MATVTIPFPEDLVIAILNKVGPDVRIVDDNRLAKIFNNAAVEGGVFEQFEWHPQYHYSKLLSDTLQILDQGGSIIRENPATTYFRISDHTAGLMVKLSSIALDPNDQKAVARNR